MTTTAISTQRTQGQLQVREMQGKRGRNGGGLNGKKGLDLPSGKYTTTKTLTTRKINQLRGYLNFEGQIVLSSG